MRGAALVSEGVTASSRSDSASAGTGPIAWPRRTSPSRGCGAESRSPCSCCGGSRSGPGASLAFDYQLRDGVVGKGNALALMRAVGLEL